MVTISKRWPVAMYFRMVSLLMHAIQRKCGPAHQRDFVCCYCLASKTLELLKDVECLQQEIQEIREYGLEAGKQTAFKWCGNKVGSSSDERKVRSYSAAVRESPKGKEVKLQKNKERTHTSEEESTAGFQQGATS